MKILIKILLWCNFICWIVVNSFHEKLLEHLCCEGQLYYNIMNWFIIGSIILSSSILVFYKQDNKGKK